MKFNVGDICKVISEESNGFSIGEIVKITEKNTKFEDYYLATNGKNTFYVKDCEMELINKNEELLQTLNEIKKIDDMGVLNKDGVFIKETGRRFEYVSRIKNTEFSLPKRSTSKSAGYDFFVPEDTVCKSHEITMVKTGVKAYFPDNETLLLFNRSSNPKKKGLIILNRCSELRIATMLIMKATKVRLLDYFIICLMKMLF